MSTIFFFHWPHRMCSGWDLKVVPPCLNTHIGREAPQDAAPVQRQAPHSSTPLLPCASSDPSRRRSTVSCQGRHSLTHVVSLPSGHWTHMRWLRLSTDIVLTIFTCRVIVTPSPLERRHPRKTADMEMRKIKKLSLCYYICIGFFYFAWAATDAFTSLTQVYIFVCAYTHSHSGRVTGEGHLDLKQQSWVCSSQHLRLQIELSLKN